MTSDDMNRSQRFHRKWLSAVIPALALMLVLRIVALDSDAYPRLSWSGALLTDEGYYIHNARNVVLFGQARLDGFNNMLIMPLLHGVQVVVFRCFGVGAIQARLISVFLSLLSVPLFFASLRRAFDLRIALLATLFWGLDHITLLYSRMALMDVPAAAMLIGALFAFVRGGRGLFCCGFLLGLAYATRGLTLFLVPIVFAALWWSRRDLPVLERKRNAAWLAGGLLGFFSLYLIFWYAPNRAEISAASHYYLARQLMPHSLAQWFRNVLLNLFDYRRGMMPYLFRHSPVQFILAMSGSLAWLSRLLQEAFRSGPEKDQKAQTGFLTKSAFSLCAAWMLLPMALFSGFNYMPSRYYVLYYPAMAALAAVTLFQAKEILKEVRRFPCMAGPFLAFLLLLGAQSVWSLWLEWGATPTALFYFCMSGVFTTFLYGKERSGLSKNPTGSKREQESMLPGLSHPLLVPVCIAFWSVVNFGWTADWLLHLTYRQRDADRWLERNLPVDSVLFGDVAPGLCLNNRFKVINVIPGLCNDQKPLETFSAPHRYILLLDEGWKERWWVLNYPEAVARTRRLHAFPQMLRSFYVIGVYPAEGSATSGNAAPHFPGLP